MCRMSHFCIFLAGHPAISNATHVSHLPPSWGTLHELTKVEPAVLKAAIKDGRVNPKMERKEVAALLSPDVMHAHHVTEARHMARFAWPNTRSAISAGSGLLERELRL
jgi:hypothetical protein